MNSIAIFFGRFNQNYFFSTPADTSVIWLWFALFVVALALTIAVFIFYFLKGDRKSPYRSYAKFFLWPNLSFSVTGFFLVLLRLEALNILSWRIWVFMDLVFIAIFNIWFFIVRRQLLQDELKKQTTKKRKEKWLKK